MNQARYSGSANSAFGRRTTRGITATAGSLNQLVRAVAVLRSPLERNRTSPCRAQYRSGIESSRYWLIASVARPPSGDVSRSWMARTPSPSTGSSRPRAVCPSWISAIWLSFGIYSSVDHPTAIYFESRPVNRYAVGRPTVWKTAKELRHDHFMARVSPSCSFRPSSGTARPRYERGPYRSPRRYRRAPACICPSPAQFHTSGR